MIDLSTVPRTDGVFPNVLARSDSAPGAKDGTPLHQKWVDDLFGAFQAILNGASLSPSGSQETCGASAGSVTGSQIVEALQLLVGVPGEIVGWPSLTIPTGARLLALEGQVVSLTTYPRLVNVYCGNANNATAPAYYKTSDAGGTTRSTSGNYLVLDDLRGMFLRGYDPTAIIDPQGASREFGGIQQDAIKDHEHDGLYKSASEVHSGVPTGTDLTISVVNNLIAGPGFATGGLVSGYGYTETRPTNSIVRWCIRY